MPDLSRDVWPFDWSPPTPHHVDPANPHAEQLEALGRAMAISAAQAGLAFAQLIEAFNAAGRQLARSVEQAAPAFAELRRQLAEAGMVPLEPPADPRARALHARRNRGTGPALPRLDRR